MTIRVVIADDHALMREGLRRILATDPAFTIVGEAKDGHEALAAVRAGGFDVLLLDLSMPGRGGIELVRQVKTERPELKVLVLSMHDEQQFAERAIRAGASGYLTKDTAGTQLVAALHKIAAGGLLAMLTNSLMPFAFDRGKDLAGVATVVGFCLTLLNT